MLFDEEMDVRGDSAASSMEELDHREDGASFEDELIDSDDFFRKEDFSAVDKIVGVCCEVRLTFMVPFP